MESLLLYDTLLEIFEMLNFIDQMHFTMVCKWSQDFHITDFSKYPGVLTQEVLDRYLYITKLNVDNNPNVVSVKHLTKLQILHACGTCGIDDAGLEEYG